MFFLLHTKTVTKYNLTTLNNCLLILLYKVKTWRETITTKLHSAGPGPNHQTVPSGSTKHKRIKQFFPNLNLSLELAQQRMKNCRVNTFWVYAHLCMCFGVGEAMFLFACFQFLLHASSIYLHTFLFVFTPTIHGL